MLPADALTGLKVDPRTFLIVPFLKSLGPRDRQANDLEYVSKLLGRQDGRDLAALGYRDALFPTDLEQEYRVQETAGGYERFPTPKTAEKQAWTELLRWRVRERALLTPDELLGALRAGVLDACADTVDDMKDSGLNADKYAEKVLFDLVRDVCWLPGGLEGDKEPSEAEIRGEVASALELLGERAESGTSLEQLLVALRGSGAE